MFQDSAGTVPAALESPVGKQLDLSGNNNHRTQATSANRPTLSARYNLLTDTAVLATQSITTVAASYTIYFTGSGTVTLAGTYIGSFTAETNTFTATAGTLVVTVVGSVLTADIRPTNQTTTLPAYQEVTSSTVYDTAGFPQYIKYNGSNTYLVTAAVNFSSTAQVAVFSGIRKLGNLGGIVDFSLAGNFNTFALLASGAASEINSYSFISRGTALASTQPPVAIYTPPITNVLTGLGNISAPSVTLRIDGAQVSSSTATQGTGNFSNLPLYFGSRQLIAPFFNGQEYQTIIVGKTLTAAEITATEKFVNNKTRAY
jgi:hypothetical protein